MREEDVLEIDQTYVGAEQLPLRAGRRRRGSPQEDELEVHGSRS